MTRPTRASKAGQVYLDIQNLARRSRRPTDELLALYTLEGFLHRLSESPVAGGFVLKGGVLLSAFEARRPTRDIDLHTVAIANDPEGMLDVVREIAGRPIDDGLVYDLAGATASTIRDLDAYAGVRIRMGSRLATACIEFHVDVSVGDPISPPADTYRLPRLLGADLSLRGYPLSMVHAEKIVTAVQRGSINTRWRDFADVYVLSQMHDLDGTEFLQALHTVARHRLVTLRPLIEALDGLAERGATRWRTWSRKLSLTDRLPAELAEVISAVSRFADPALSGEVGDRTWRAATQIWQA